MAEDEKVKYEFVTTAEVKSIMADVLHSISVELNWCFRYCNLTSCGLEEALVPDRLDGRKLRAWYEKRQKRRSWKRQLSRLIAFLFSVHSTSLTGSQSGTPNTTFYLQRTLSRVLAVGSGVQACMCASKLRWFQDFLNDENVIQSRCVIYAHTHTYKLDKEQSIGSTILYNSVVCRKVSKNKTGVENWLAELYMTP